MAVVIETTLGDITVDLFLKERPRASRNFLKLCKIKYYNYNLFHTISRGFIAQTGDPTGSRKGGESIHGVIEGPLKRYFQGEKMPRIKHTHMGLVSFVGNEDGMIGSQFFITLGEDLSYLDDKHCVFGEVMEGLDVLELINESICDQESRPYKDVRITHTVILEDPFPDLERMRVPTRSPSPSAERLQGGRIAADEDIDDTQGKNADEVNEMIASREAQARATILEMVGDIPDADMAPPENVLFVCKLNPVTTDDDLEIIFSRFGRIKSCEVIRDKKSGDSLQYAFVEFEEQKSCEDAFFKMDNVLIDDRRIHVDFSQSVAKIKWHGKGRGVTTYDEQGRKSRDAKNDLGRGIYKKQGKKVGNDEKKVKNNYKSRDNYKSLDYKHKDDYKYDKRQNDRDESRRRSYKSNHSSHDRRDDYKSANRNLEKERRPYESKRRQSKSPTDAEREQKSSSFKDKSDDRRNKRDQRKHEKWRKSDSESDRERSRSKRRH